jgi:glycosyltransferase involved in cell wall biosynthesis
VAVVVPCFNDGEYLREALASLLEQEACELVVVDDGSTNSETLRLLDELRAEGIRVVSQENAGLGPARMTGVRHTSAPFVHPLDSDDRLAPGALTKLADALESRPDVGVAWGHYRTFGASDCLFPSAPELDPWRITYLDEIPGTCMIRRTTLEEFGGWRHAGYEDWDLWMRYAAQGVTGIGIQSTTLLYREHPQPRLFQQTLIAHDRHWSALEAEHRSLFKARRLNRSRSSSPRRLKLLLPAIDAIPGLTSARKRQLWALARYFIQRERCSTCYRGPVERFRRRVGDLVRGGDRATH